MSSKTKKNRTKELRRILNQTTRKQKFNIIRPRQQFPGQKIQLYSTKFANNFQAQQLMNTDPAEYIRQKMKLQAKKNMASRKYNRSQKTKTVSKRPNIHNLLVQLERERLGLE